MKHLRIFTIALTIALLCSACGSAVQVRNPLPVEEIEEFHVGTIGDTKIVVQHDGGSSITVLRTNDNGDIIESINIEVSPGELIIDAEFADGTTVTNHGSIDADYNVSDLSIASITSDNPTIIPITPNESTSSANTPIDHSNDATVLEDSSDTKVHTPIRIAKLSVSDKHMCAIDLEGALYCQGDNDQFQTGILTSTDHVGSLTRVSADTGHTFTDIWTSTGLTYAKTSAGSVLTYGLSTFTGNPINFVANIRDMALSKESSQEPISCAIDTAHTAHCWQTLNAADTKNPVLQTIENVRHMAIQNDQSVLIAHTDGSITYQFLGEKGINMPFHCDAKQVGTHDETTYVLCDNQELYGSVDGLKNYEIISSEIVSLNQGPATQYAQNIYDEVFLLDNLTTPERHQFFTDVTMLSASEERNVCAVNAVETLCSHIGHELLDNPETPTLIELPGNN